MTEIRIIPVPGVPEVPPGADLGALLSEALGAIGIRDGDVIVVTQKVVSKAEGRLVPAAERDRAVAAESRRILRRTAGGMTISETHHGFVCANAGVDASNIEGDMIALLPVDPDLSARRLRASFRHRLGADVGVVISDTFGRAWRAGQTDVAIGVAGFKPVNDHRGLPDMQGREMTATQIAVADEIAGAAELAMGKTTGVCAVVVRGFRIEMGRGSSRDLVRPPAQDLFR